jgi:hypothetical protein
MRDYLLVETRDPIEVRDVEWGGDLLVQLRRAGARCSMMLTENGVLGLRASARTSFPSSLIDGGVAVLADRFALAERGMHDADVAQGVVCSDLGAVVDALEAGAIVIWR